MDNLGGTATELVLTGQRTELGRLVAEQWARQPPQARGRTLVNVALQPPNSLLHDGHAWAAMQPDRIIASTRRAMAEAARTHCGYVIHASWAFLGAAEAGGRVGGRLRPIVEAALEAEQLVIGGDRAGVVLRLGYLYGPESRDLRAYRRAFALRRPYWAGPRDNLQLHLHSHDAARALISAAAGRPAGPVLYATDERPASFAEFMDHFAHLVGNAHPMHIPGMARLLVRPVVRQPHVEMCELASDGRAMPRLPGFTARYPDYRAGLGQVVEAWRSSH